jgi:hypothetical protein
MHTMLYRTVKGGLGIPPGLILIVPPPKAASLEKSSKYGLESTAQAPKKSSSFTYYAQAAATGMEPAEQHSNCGARLEKHLPDVGSQHRKLMLLIYLWHLKGNFWPTGRVQEDNNAKEAALVPVLPLSCRASSWLTKPRWLLKRCLPAINRQIKSLRLSFCLFGTFIHYLC